MHGNERAHLEDDHKNWNDGYVYFMQVLLMMIFKQIFPFYF